MKILAKSYTLTLDDFPRATFTKRLTEIIAYVLLWLGAGQFYHYTIWLLGLQWDIYACTVSMIYRVYMLSIRYKGCRKISNIRRTNSQYFNNSRFVLQLSLPNPLKPGVKSRMKMWLEQRRQAMFQLHLSDQQFNCILMLSYMREFTVYLIPHPFQI